MTSRLKITHLKTQFLFDVNGKEYHVVCVAAKRGDNEFVFFKDGLKIGKRTPNGGHVNKTSASEQLERFLNCED